MNKFLKTTLLLALLLFAPLLAGAQQTGSASAAMQYLDKNFPKLTDLYRDELLKYPAHYVFAIDVSGTMNQYQQIVVSSLAPFFQALPDGDRVDVIPFGTDALPNMVSYSGEINPAVRDALTQNLPRLYNDPSYPDGFKGFTNIESVVKAIAKVIQTNREYKVNVIIILTDFRNDVKGDIPSEHKLTEAQLAEMNNLIAAATKDTYTRSVALELPVNNAAPGYCLQQLKSSVFPTDGTGMEIVPMTNPGSMISQWFEQLKRDIMVTKLRAIIEMENKSAPIELKTKVDIDGNVKANVHWTPSKLYPAMHIDSTYVDAPGFRFINNKKNFKDTTDPELKLKLGKIKHNSLGMHHFNDSIHLGLSLPTPYDSELEALGVHKPMPDTSTKADKWIWTFPLPFWLCCLILLLAIAYICWVLAAISRNAKYKVDADVLYFDSEGDNLEDKGRTRVRGVNGFKVGRGGTNRCSLPDADWQIEVNRVKSNPFMPWTKPHIEWHSSYGRVYLNRKADTCGRLDKIKNTKARRLHCLDTNGELTHMVTIEIKQS